MANAVLDLQVRKAILSDIGPVAKLINDYARDGIMLPRTEFELAESVRDFTVVYRDSRLLGCGALHIYTPESGEVRSLAVNSQEKGNGVGRIIVENLEREANEFGLYSLFAFTYVPDFFAKLGFGAVDRDELPLKAWKDCLRCPKFKACDEVPVLKKLKNSVPKRSATLNCGDSIFPIMTRTIGLLVPELKV